MNPVIEQQIPEIENLCRRYNVARLEIFGSAAEGADTAENSDVDFLVDFRPEQDLGPWLAHYFDLKSDLEKLLGRKVDLLMKGALKNPWFIREVNRTRRLLYAA